ncbi:MAG: cytochrome c551/c552 [Patiriisocius sp.]|jgi:cytochrome c551/c552
MNLRKVKLRTAAKIFFQSTIVLAFLLSFVGGYAQDVANGEKIFNQNCTSCHSPGEKVVAAPGLKGVAERWAGKEDLLYTWIQNPNKAIATGDAYITNLVNENKAKYGLMAAQAVTKTEIDDILAYVAAYVPVIKDPTGTTPEGDVAVVEEGIPGYWWGILAILFAFIVWILSGVRKQLTAAAYSRDGKVYEEPGTWDSFKKWVISNRTLTGIVALLLIATLVVQGWNAAATIGIYEGYMPEQPIAFSHKLHAGDNKIDCQYCHSTAEKSKSPLVPSTNVCMNCHKYVAKGPTGDTTEIEKIYEAIGWDKETFTYSGETNPVKWIKVHDLPDHVYFNHAQHVKVGKLECKECHGAVEEMDVIRQEKPLTMEWCISCHNETEVQMAGNGYYDEISERLRNNEAGVELLKEYLEDGKITAKELGGWECAKCHY